MRSPSICAEILTTLVEPCAGVAVGTTSRPSTHLDASGILTFPPILPSERRSAREAGDNGRTSLPERGGHLRRMTLL